MTIILFLIALILAWPTYGLSIVVYVLLLIFMGLLKTKTKLYHINKIRAQQEINLEKKIYPSWMENKKKIEEFIYAIENMAEHKGVPKIFSVTLFANKEISNKFYLYAGQMESHGASYTEQQLAIVEAIVDYYRVL